MGEISLAKVNAINKIVTIDKLLEILFVENKSCLHNPNKELIFILIL